MLDDYWFLLGIKLLHANYSGYEVEVDFDPKELEERLITICKSNPLHYVSLLVDYPVIRERVLWFLEDEK